ncbi:2Fe-2S iron-sulfur cluster-binding protein [Streptomyces justiciae]|uniref:2Fe-2S iron-sulfur cluster-binding protein n=1 Tax=Streptomyces justiciae TaxID=2780140 RepID=UPI002117B226|nr:2Fe-2S iron-sulfur cluster-binding protein [Streptomyces justiciae]MCW8377651.1 2Fe-2S iron-sulfur cluster-binding protein [Streptomyces justiciae]
MTVTSLGVPRRLLEFALDGEPVCVPEGTTLLDACRAFGKEIPALCQVGTLALGGGCRLCVVEVEGTDALVAACCREAEPGMRVRTGSERVRHSRRTVLELLASSVDLSTTPQAMGWIEEYGARPDRFFPDAARSEEAPILDNGLVVRDPGKCLRCGNCVAACGGQGRHTFALAVSGRGAETRVGVEYDAPLTDSACVYCGDCLDVCPTGALSSRTEFDLRAAGTWDEPAQTATTTVCGHCGVGCRLTLHVQDNEIVKVTSPHDGPVTRGHLCIKGRFGHQYIQNRD